MVQHEADGNEPVCNTIYWSIILANCTEGTKFINNSLLNKLKVKAPGFLQNAPTQNQPPDYAVNATLHWRLIWISYYHCHHGLNSFSFFSHHINNAAVQSSMTDNAYYSMSRQIIIFLYLLQWWCKSMMEAGISFILLFFHYLLFNGMI
jgi:hypothetical protein